MNFGWESEKEKLQRMIDLPPRKKLEWLLKINEFSSKCLSPSHRNVLRKRLLNLSLQK